MFLLSPNMSRLLLLCHFPSRFLALVVTLLPLIKWLSRCHYVIPISCSVLLQMKQTYDSLLWPSRPCRSGLSLELCFLTPIHSSSIPVLMRCFSNVTSMFSSQASSLHTTSGQKHEPLATLSRQVPTPQSLLPLLDPPLPKVIYLLRLSSFHQDIHLRENLTLLPTSSEVGTTNTCWMNKWLFILFLKIHIEILCLC